MVDKYNSHPEEIGMLYIYLTENLVNGRMYIGQHSGEIDDGYLGSGVILKKAIEKYGATNFRKLVLATANDQDHLNALEKEYVSKYRELYPGKLYNLTDGGTGGNTCRYLPPDIVSKTRSGWFAKMSQDEQEALRKLKSEQMKERRKDPDSEQRRISKLKATLNQKSAEARSADYDNRRGPNAPNRKTVQTPLGIFSSLTAAAKAHNITVTTVANRCNYAHLEEWKWL
jgi:hypothetical protein